MNNKQNMGYKSIAILCDSSCPVERLQVNYWAHAELKNVHALDVGIDFYPSISEGKAGIFLPFPLKKDEVSCLGKSLNDNQLLPALFNTDCETRCLGDGGFDLYVGENKISKRVIYMLPDQLDICAIDGGTIVAFKIAPNEEQNRYIRLRISSTILHKVFCTESIPVGSWLQSAITKNREVDFRVNSLRGLPPIFSDKDGFAKCQNDNLKCFSRAHLEQTHVFYIANSSETLIFQDRRVTSTRFLEENVWKKYMPKSTNKYGAICAYHWKFTDGKEDVALFFRSNFHSTNSITIIKYLLITIILAMMINIASSFSYDKLITHLQTPTSDSTEHKESSRKLNPNGNRNAIHP